MREDVFPSPGVCNLLVFSFSSLLSSFFLDFFYPCSSISTKIYSFDPLFCHSIARNSPFLCLLGKVNATDSIINYNDIYTMHSGNDTFNTIQMNKTLDVILVSLQGLQGFTWMVLTNQEPPSPYCQHCQERREKCGDFKSADR